MSSKRVSSERVLGKRAPSEQPTDQQLIAFRKRVLEQGKLLYRDLPWRNTRDPYAIWISEVMLQQTQVSRVDGRWQHWMQRFPTVPTLAAADSADVLDEWQGLGYNRRALLLHRAAQQLMDRVHSDASHSCNGRTHAEFLDSHFPQEISELVRLPGIGVATAAGIRAFAFNLPSTYIETNVRAVFLHEFFPNQHKVSDAQLIGLVEKTCPADALNPDDDPRSWYYALLDYGAYLKKTLPNPSRRSATHVKQSQFEGSHRQKRAALVRILLQARRDKQVLDELSLALLLNEHEQKAGRPDVEKAEFLQILAELQKEGFCHKTTEGWCA